MSQTGLLGMCEASGDLGMVRKKNLASKKNRDKIIPSDAHFLIFSELRIDMLAVTHKKFLRKWFSRNGDTAF